MFKINRKDRRALKFGTMGHTAEYDRVSFRAPVRQGCGCVGLCRHRMSGKGHMVLIGTAMVRQEGTNVPKRVYRISTMSRVTNTATGWKGIHTVKK
jgi:hypothetical protein